MDSGATTHKTNNKTLLNIFSEELKNIQLTDNSIIESKGTGNSEVVNNDRGMLPIYNVLYVPKLKDNILSVPNQQKIIIKSYLKRKIV